MLLPGSLYDEAHYQRGLAFRPVDGELAFGVFESAERGRGSLPSQVTEELLMRGETVVQLNRTWCQQVGKQKSMLFRCLSDSPNRMPLTAPA